MTWRTLSSHGGVPSCSLTAEVFFVFGEEKRRIFGVGQEGLKRRRHVDDLQKMTRKKDVEGLYVLISDDILCASGNLTERASKAIGYQNTQPSLPLQRP